MTAMHPARRKKNLVNYCFKSSCEINETLRALCWLKRSLPAFNRLFNHTQLELCVCSFLPFLNTVPCTVHANSRATCRDVFTNEDWMSPVCDQSSCPSNSTDKASCILFCKTYGCYCHFCFPALFQWGLGCPSLLCAFCFKWSVYWGKTGFHTHCQSFSLPIPPYLYFQLFLFFYHTSF